MENQQLIDALLGLTAIDSVALTEVSDAAPYGTGPAKALEYVMELCTRLGIRTVNRSGRVAWAEIGQGDEIVGILGHLDVVPAGDGWTHDKRGEIAGDRIYGRGVVDDKGPTLAALFAMKELQDAGTALKRRVRLIFGQCEEDGDWGDMNYYLEHEEHVAYGFTPDADFPAIYGEKGILEFRLTMPLEGSGLVSIEGGEASNVVPEWARCVYLDANGGRQELAAQGRSAHASTPEKGANAIGKPSATLLERAAPRKSTDVYAKHLLDDYHGGKLGCGLADEQSGKLTVNSGLVRVEGGNIVLTLDIRNPVSYTRSDVEAPLKRLCKEYGMSLECTDDLAGVYMDKEGPVIKALLDVYRTVTGDMSEPTVIGGGTYARAMPGIVAYGPMRPGRECTEHQRDEYILIEDLFAAKEIYRQAIERLANL